MQRQPNFVSLLLHESMVYTLKSIEGIFCLPVGHDCRDAAWRVLFVIANSQLAFTLVPGKQTVSCTTENLKAASLDEVLLDMV